MNNRKDDDFLQKLGGVVRGLRASRGMTRKMLANDSTVSERYLANIETGKGNISINLLRQVADALNVNLVELFPSSAKQSPELKLIIELVSNLSREEQQSILHSLYQESSRFENKQQRIALIGLRGAGKTTLGKILEQRTNLQFIQLTDTIESIAGMPVPEILALSGQSGYRRIEEKALMNTLTEFNFCCIETGGSIVSDPKELNLLLTTCFVIWVRATPEEHMKRVIEQGDKRPMADNEFAMQDLRSILNEREPYYEQAHAVLDTSDKNLEESYSELVEIISRKIPIL
ncbi:MAG: transcriptional regulator [Gammaproteobacteria bacterium]|nr:MAG: transcriptional regulator [Gammaproteobacteria bacterium]